MLKEIVEKLNEGAIWNKVQKWLIQNVKPITKKYISYSSAYANERIIVNNPSKNIILQTAKDGFVYLKVIDKNSKEFFLMTDDDVMMEYEELITGEFGVRLVCAKMPDFEVNGFTPSYLYRVYVR